MKQHKRGAPNKYEQIVKPRFNEILEWLKLGATEKEIAKNLGVHKSTFIEYKKKYIDLANLIKKGRENPVVQIKAAMLKSALGFEYEEKKVITQKIVIDGVNGDKVPGKLIRTEITTKFALPDTAAGLILLQHWDKNEDGSNKWSRDPSSKEIKEKELELKKQALENESW